MKVLFLDIDGVLNRDGTRERIGGYVGLDKKLVDKLLGWLASHPEVQLVLSSTWRLDGPLSVDLKAYLRESGIFSPEKKEVATL